MTKNVTIDGLISAINDIVDELILIENKPTVEINKEGVTPSETLTTLTQGDTTYSIASGGAYSIDILAGDMTATYTGTTPSYALESTKTSIAAGKHYSDYDELCVVTIGQQTASESVPRAYYYTKIPVWALSHCDGNLGVTVCTMYSYNGTAGQGTRVCIYPDDSYRNDWYNYASPIAILGIKYN